MAGLFNDHMQLNPNLVIQDAEPSPNVHGFNDVPIDFRPAAYKMIHNALRIENFSLGMVLAPGFGYVQNIPTLVAMENRIATLEVGVLTLQAGVDALQISVNQILLAIEFQQQVLIIQTKGFLFQPTPPAAVDSGVTQLLWILV